MTNSTDQAYSTLTIAKQLGRTDSRVRQVARELGLGDRDSKGYLFSADEAQQIADAMNLSWVAPDQTISDSEALSINLEALSDKTRTVYISRTAFRYCQDLVECRLYECIDDAATDLIMQHRNDCFEPPSEALND